MLASQCDVIGQLDAAHKTNLMHSQIRLVTGRKRVSNPTTCIEDKECNIIMEKEKILYWWFEYIGELYNDDRGDMPEIVAEVESPNTQREVTQKFICMIMIKVILKLAVMIVGSPQIIKKYHQACPHLQKSKMNGKIF